MLLRAPAAAIAMASLALVGAQDSDLRFDVASVKPHIDPPRKTMFMFGGNSRNSVMQISGTRLMMRGTITNLLLSAYHLRSYELSGDLTLSRVSGPGDQIYDVDARMPGNQTPPLDDVRKMLQNMLVERFQMTFHREMKEMSGYDLVVAGGGAKLQKSAPEAETTIDQDMPAAGVMRLKCQNVTTWELAARLGEQFDKPLIDKTGLTGGWNFAVEYTPQRRSNLNPDAAAGVDQLLGPEDERKPVVVSLEKLGLKVVSAKERVTVLVVDHVEKPAEN